MPRQPLGAECKQSSECGSGFCVDARCCERERCGTCEVCGSDGRCAAVREASDADSCPSPKLCTGGGACGAANGAPCSTANECGSEICADAYCCNKTCGVCESCALPGRLGICTPVQGFDELGTCSVSKSCSSSGVCLDSAIYWTYATDPVQNWMLGGAIGSAAQVIAFREPAKLEEVRVIADCAAPAEPLAWVESVTADGVPSGSRVREAKWIRQVLAPERDHFHTLKLETALPLVAGDRYAFVVSAPAGASCEVQINSTMPYPEGAAFLQDPNSSVWSQQAGTAIRFKTLVSR